MNDLQNEVFLAQPHPLRKVRLVDVPLVRQLLHHVYESVVLERAVHLEDVRAAEQGLHVHLPLDLPASAHRVRGRNVTVGQRCRRWIRAAAAADNVFLGVDLLRRQHLATFSE